MFSLFVFFIQNSVNAQTINVNGEVVNLSEQVSNLTVFNNSSPVVKSTSIWNNVRTVSELNSNGADAYPYISSDGLRLYFTQDSIVKQLFMASRGVNDYNTPFSNVQLLGSGYQGTISCWLTNDELELYFSNGSDIILHCTNTGGLNYELKH